MENKRKWFSEKKVKENIGKEEAQTGYMCINGENKRKRNSGKRGSCCRG